MNKSPFIVMAKCLSALALVVGLAACGGGDTPPANALSGTAAVGAPIVGGTIDVTCAGGSALTTTTGSNGFWTVTTSGQTLPCAVRVSSGTINGTANTTPYHSIAINLGTVNLTPLTNLVVANLTGVSPATWFTGLNAPVLQGISSTAISTAIANINTQLGTGTALNGMNPLTSAFGATNGDRMDDVLEALQAAINAWSGSGYGGLLAQAWGGFSEFGSSFSISFGSQFALTTTGTGGAGGGSSGVCSGSEVSATYAGNTAGTHTNGQQLCFAASATALTFSGQTLSNPVQNTGVAAPFTAYVFTDTAANLTYEAVFNSGVLYEINVSLSGVHKGGFAPSAAGGGAAGSGSLTVDVFLTSVVTVPNLSFNVSNVPQPSGQTDFCNALQTDTTFSSIESTGGGSFTINSCTFSGAVGTVQATLQITTPIAMTIPYTIRYTYN